MAGNSPDSLDRSTCSDAHLTTDSALSGSSMARERTSSSLKQVRMRRSSSASESIPFQIEKSMESFHESPEVPHASHRGSNTSSQTEASHRHSGSVGARKKSVVGDQILDAWITKGWTLRQSMISNRIEFDEQPDVDMDVAEHVQIAQKHYQQLGEVNKVLHSALVEKKMEKNTLIEKIKHLDGLLSAHRLEEAARQTSMSKVQDDTGKYEKETQQMQLELNQRISDSEAQILNLESGNEELQTLNGRNKKILRAQLNEIKERQKACRHLQRQIHVLEGASSSMKKGVFRAKLLPDQAVTSHQTSQQSWGTGSLGFSDDAGGNAGDSSPILQHSATLVDTSPTGVKEKQVKPLALEKRAKTCIHLDRTTTITARSIEDYKSLPGLNLAFLLGEV